jgi:hypothetical protein
MAREKGTSIFPATLEVRAGALDPRLVVDTYAELMLGPDNENCPWPVEGNIAFTYPGMVVSVINDGANNGLYMLTNGDYKDAASWKKIGGNNIDLDLINSSIKFKGTVSMDSTSEMSAIFDSMSVGESCFLTPVTGVSGNATGYGSWVNTAFNDTVIQINDSLFKSDTSGLELTGSLTGKWNDNHMGTIKTFLNIDKNVRTCKCSDLILLSKINVQVKEVLPLLGDLASSIAGIIPDTLMLTACIGKVIRFSDADWVANNKDLLLKFPTYHGDYEGGTYWMYDPNNALRPGVYPTCSNDLIYNKKHPLNNGIIAKAPDSDSTRTNPISLFTPGGYFTLFVTASTTKDTSGYTSIEQTAYGRDADAGKVYKRIIFIHDTEPYDTSDWYRIDNVDSINENYTRYGWSNAENYLDTLIYTGVCPYTQATINVYVGNMDPDDVDSSAYKDGWMSYPSNFTVFVNRSVDPDSSGYYHLTQKAYDRASHRIFYRLGWYKLKTINKFPDSNYTEFEDGPVFTNWQYPVIAEDYVSLSAGMRHSFGICSTFSYATCHSYATDQYKVITLYSPITQKSLKNGLYTGLQLNVRFENTNSVSNIKLKFADELNLESAPVRYKGNSPRVIPYWPAKSVVTFVYNGAEWDIMSMSEPFATDTVPGIVSTSEQTFAGNKTFNGNLIIQNASATEGSGASPSLVFRKGTDSDNAFDWDIFNNSASKLFIRTQYDNSGTKTWTNALILEKDKATFAGNVTATKFVGTVNLSGSYTSGVLTITAGGE